MPLGFHALPGKIKTKRLGRGGFESQTFWLQVTMARASTTGVVIHPLIETRTLVYIIKGVL